jgi:hypothetical protein
VSAFLAGDDPDARTTVAALTTDLDLVPVDCGLVVNARQIERAAQLAISVIVARGELLTTLSINSVPHPERPTRLGGRELSEQTAEDLRPLAE